MFWKALKKCCRLSPKSQRLGTSCVWYRRLFLCFWNGFDLTVSVLHFITLLKHNITNAFKEMENVQEKENAEGLMSDV